MNCRTECSISKSFKTDFDWLKIKVNNSYHNVVIEKYLINKTTFRQRKKFFGKKKKQNYTSVPFLKIAPIRYIYNLLKNLFNFALVRLK